MVSLNFKSILLGFGGAVAMTAVLASVQMYQPAKLPVEEQQQAPCGHLCGAAEKHNDQSTYK